MYKILVTGANGFIGRYLCSRLIEENCVVIGAISSQEKSYNLPSGIESVVIDPTASISRWNDVLSGKDIIFHLAARVHVIRERAAEPHKEYRRVNVEWTEQLARLAAAAGVRRFVFMSTIGVNGDNSGAKPFTESDQPRPNNPYTISKYEAEQALWCVARETGLEVVDIRAPLVYGPGNPGNFHSLIRIVARGIPLPFSSVKNLRSFIFVRNLVDALVTSAKHPLATGKTYLVSDREDVSTAELIRYIAFAQGTTARLFPFPPVLLRFAGKLTGMTPVVNKLICSLTVDSSTIGRDLGWSPPFTMKEGMRETMAWYNGQAGSLSRLAK